MQTKKNEVKERILKEAKQLFLIHGFEKTSIRSIATHAGVTSGTLYTYFKDKNAVFETIVSPTEERFVMQMQETMTGFHRTLDDLTEAFSKEVAVVVLLRLLELIYDHVDVFKLLLLCAKGSSKEDFTMRMTKKYVQLSSKLLTAIMKKQGRITMYSEVSVRIIFSIFFQIFVQIIRTEMTREQAKQHVNEWAGIIYGAWDGLLKS